MTSRTTALLRKRFESLRLRTRPIRRTRPVRRAGAALMHQQYRGLLRRQPFADLMHVLVASDLCEPEDRRHSVDRLTELFFDLIAALRVEVFVEAGAKDAGASRRADQIAHVERVIAFEANPATYRRFASTFEGTGVEYVHQALADTAGEFEFNIRLNAKGRRKADGQGSLLGRPDYEPGHETIVVPAVRLDTVVETSGRPVAVWMDVEGANHMVLSGAARLLPHVEVLIVEVEERRIWEGQLWRRREVVQELETFGLVPVARDRQSRVQFNIVFVKKERSHDAAVSRLLSDFRRDGRPETSD